MLESSYYQNAINNERATSKTELPSKEDLEIVVDKAHEMRSRNEITEEKFYNLCYAVALVENARASSRSVEEVLSDILRLENESDYKNICDSVKDGEQLVNKIYDKLFISKSQSSIFAARSA